MNSFFGTYKLALDEKNRLRIPSKLRASLGETFYVLNGNAECLFLYGKEEFNLMTDKFDCIPLSDTEAQESMRTILASVVEPEEDTQKRFILPQITREYASIKKNVVFIGVKSRIEIWSEETYNLMTSITEKGSVQKSFERLKNYGI